MREVDWDLLADHLGGALAGTAEDGRIANLIVTDPAWARAAADLSTALAAVAADLNALPAPVMPDDVVARLEGALHGASTVLDSVPSGARSGHVAAARPSAGDASTGPGRHSRTATAGGSPRPAGRPASRRRRFTRWGSGLAVAMGLVAFVAFGISSLGIWVTGGADESGGIATDQGGRVTASDQPQLSADQPRVLASGRDYARTDLSEQAAAPMDAERPPDRAGPLGAPDPGAEAAPGGVPEALVHLWPLPDECLAEVIASYLPETVVPEVVDYAAFEGQPAIVIWVTTPEGVAWVSVVGPGCGTPGGGIDERHRSRLG